MITNIFPGAGNGQARAAVFMSGTGTNAEALFRYHAGHPECRFVPALIVTDAPEHSRARELAAAWNIPLVEHDIRAFYAARGETAISLVSERRRAIRSEWTEALRELVLPWKIDFGVLAGFVPVRGDRARRSSRVADFCRLRARFRACLDREEPRDLHQQLLYALGRRESRFGPARQGVRQAREPVAAVLRQDRHRPSDQPLDE